MAVIRGRARGGGSELDQPASSANRPDPALSPRNARPILALSCLTGENACRGVDPRSPRAQPYVPSRGDKRRNWPTVVVFGALGAEEMDPGVPTMDHSRFIRSSLLCCGTRTGLSNPRTRGTGSDRPPSTPDRTNPASRTRFPLPRHNNVATHLSGEEQTAPSIFLSHAPRFLNCHFFGTSVSGSALA